MKKVLTTLMMLTTFTACASDGVETRAMDEDVPTAFSIQMTTPVPSEYFGKATPSSEHKEGLTIVTHEMDGKGMDKKHGQIDQ